MHECGGETYRSIFVGFLVMVAQDDHGVLRGCETCEESFLARSAPCALLLGWGCLRLGWGRHNHDCKSVFSGCEDERSKEERVNEKISVYVPRTRKRASKNRTTGTKTNKNQQLYPILGTQELSRTFVVTLQHE
jgi:hypothetical protein